MTSLDHDSPPSAHDSLVALVGSLEDRLDTLSLALSEVRATVRQLATEAKAMDATAKPVLRVIETPAATEPSVDAEPQWAPAKQGATAEPWMPAAPIEEAPVTASSISHQAAEAAWFPVGGESAPATAEVPVEATPGEPASSAYTPSETEAVWATPDAPLIDDAAAREEVRRAVEEAKAEAAAKDWSSSPMLSAPWQSPEELANEAAANSRISARDVAAAAAAEADRDEVRRAVEQMRAELAAAGALDDEDDGPAAYGVDADPDAHGGEGEPLDADAVRDEVRRAVEQARAELAAGTLRLDGAVEPEAGAAPMWAATAPAQKEAPAHQPTRGDMEQTLAALQASKDDLHPGALSIVIEDAEGRVDLARVYDTLSRVKAADQAVLLNYTPHSVTVGVGQRTLPDTKALEAAATTVFGRPCSASAESGRLVVRIMSKPGRVVPTR